MINPTLLLDEYLTRAVNLDITSKCVLKCPKCIRQNKDTSAARDITKEQYAKVCKTFKTQDWCGQQGDCIYHPEFHDLCDIAMDHGCYIIIHTNGFGKKEKWWETTYEKLHPDRSVFFFAMDGLPSNTNIYRVNQDGHSVLNAMRMGVEKGHRIVWKYIVFSYNENNIDEAAKIAAENGIEFRLVKSSRWDTIQFDPLKPKNKRLYLER